MIQVGDLVFAKNLRAGPKWIPAVVTAQTGPVSFRVELSSSKTVWRRHLDQLRKRSCESGTTEANVDSELSDSLIDLDLSPSDINQPAISSSPDPTPVTLAPRHNPPRDRRPPDRLNL